jgi:hypothetical protein
MPTMSTLEPYGRTRTERRELAQQARRYLGNTREPPVSTRSVLRAAKAVTRLVELATGGQLTLVLVKRDDDNRLYNSQIVFWTEAIDNATTDWSL